MEDWCLHPSRRPLVQSSTGRHNVATSDDWLGLTSYETVLERVAVAAHRVGRSPDNVTVVAVSKTKSVEEILEVYQLGHRDFGENRAQELAVKAPQLPPDIRWHFVGALQSNKVRQVRQTTHLLHSMDRPSLASAWLKGIGMPPPVLLQVNIGDEPQKSGIDVGAVTEVFERMVIMGLSVRGLMAIPPVSEHPEQSRSHFRRLREILESIPSQELDLVELSMGMTDDFEVAIEEGASIIRVGRAIFGPRK